MSRFRFAPTCFALLVLLALALLARPAVAMEDESFDTLLKQVKAASFSSDKLAAIRSAAGVNTFTCEQVAKLIGALAFGTDRIAALQAVKQRIEDPANKETIFKAFAFASERDKAKAMLAGIHAAEPAGGNGSGARRVPLRVGHAGACGADEFRDLLAALDDKTFARDRLQVLAAAMRRPRGLRAPQVLAVLERFTHSSDLVAAVQAMDARILGLTCADVVAVLERLAFSNDKLTALAALVDSITDAENRFTVIPAFAFAADRQKAQAILDAARPRSHVFGRVRSRAVIFVLDVSGSMAASVTTNTGETLTRLDFVRRELRLVLANQLTPETRFNVIWFADTATKWKEQLVPATNENVSSALAAVEAIEPGGATNIGEALAAAMLDPTATTVYFLTDGKPTAGTLQTTEAVVRAVEGWLSERHRTIHGIAFLMGSHESDDKEASAGIVMRMAQLGRGRFVRLEDPASGEAEGEQRRHRGQRGRGR